MLRSYLLLAYRNLLKRKGYSAINVLGLSVGLAAVVLIFLYARHELSYDRFHEHGERVYQVYKERVTPTGTQITRDTWIPLADRLTTEYPAVQSAVRIWSQNGWVRHEDRRFEEQVTYTDPSLLNVFTYPLAVGDPATALAESNSAIVSQAVAQRYFGAESPLGKSIRIDNAVDYTVTGVFEEIPSNSTIEIDVAVPFTSLPWYADVENEWGSSFIYTYILLEQAANAAEIEAQFPALVQNIWDAEVAARTNFRLESLHNLQDALTGNRQYAYILPAVALVILLIASINFMNLATARSMERAREIGMRKVLGARRRQLVYQFIGESTLLSMASLGLGLLLVRAALPVFNRLYGLELGLDLFEIPYLPIVLLVLGLAVGVVGGAYPAFYVSRFKPVRTLQGSIRTSAGGVNVRRGLVVAQFSLAIGLIALTLVMRGQLSFLQNAELRFDSENVVIVPVEASDFDDSEAAVRHIRTFQEEIRRSPDVLAVSASVHAPGSWSNWFSFVRPEGWGEQDPLRMRVAIVDDAYFGTYGIRLLDGRTFEAERGTDADIAVVINESARRSFGWEDAVGRTLRRGDTDYEVIGVVQDYHFDSLRQPIAPVLHFYRPPENSVHNFIAARIRPGRDAAALGVMEEAWARLDPDRTLPFEFADRTFAQLYEQEQRLSSVTGAFTLLAILIACLGLLGLASWSVTQRIKEIGIRKVLGASVGGIVMLLSREFLRLVTIALVLAIPLAYLAAGRWLEDFAYRITIDPLTFAIAGLLGLFVAFITVALMAFRAALVDPATTLRYE